MPLELEGTASSLWARCKSLAERNAALDAEIARLREALRYLRAFPNAIKAQELADELLGRAAP